MQFKVLLGLGLLPILTYGQTVCLEGPQGGRCHVVNPYGEIFKSSKPSQAQVSNEITPVVIKQSVRGNPLSNRNPVYRKRLNHTIVVQQRIRERAQVIKSRADSLSDSVNQI